MCKMCGDAISENRRRRRAMFCSKICASGFYKRKWKEKNPRRVYRGRTSHTGAAHELLVSADLMLRGYEIFRALSPDCPCDLAMIRDGKMLRVQVTTGYTSLTGKMSWPFKDPKKHDLLAIVVGKEIHYIPPIDTLTAH